MKVRIATRKSPLAMWQANFVADQLRRVDSLIEVEFVSLHTSADKDLTKPISEIGGKGAFAKEVQQLVLAGEADFAVHSAKDLQAITPAGLVLGAYCARGDARDCLVGSALDDLAEGATVGTGSARRKVQLLELRPDLNIVGLRGNIATRLSRLEELDAIVMATVALERLDVNPGVVDLLSAEQMVPQVGQGALAIECRAEDNKTLALLTEVDHQLTRDVVSVERRFLQTLGGDCDMPAGAHAVADSEGVITVTGILADDTNRVSKRTVTSNDVEDPGAELARRLLQDSVG